MFSIKIKSTLVNEDIVIENCSDSCTVEWLKAAVKKELDIQESDKLLRLIYLGKLLDPPSETLKHFNLIPGACVHAFISTKKKDEFIPTSASTPSLTQPSGGIDVEQSAVIDYRGLNRLLAVGMTHEDVAALRATFQPNILEYSARAQLRRAEGESEISFRLRLEDEWIAAQGRLSEFAFNLPISNHQALFRNERHRSRSGGPSDSPSTPRVVFSSSFNMPLTGPFPGAGSGGASTDGASDAAGSEQGNWSEFLFGFAVGFTVGFIVIFCVWDRNVSYRQKIGLLAGIMASSFASMVSEEHKHQSNGRHVGDAAVSAPVGDGGSVLMTTSDASHNYLRSQ